MNRKITLMAAAVASLMTTVLQAAPDYSALGDTLTPVGAEKAGNADGSIPAYTGGLKTPPAGFQAGSGQYTDPFASEKPLLSIDAKNMDSYAGKLTEGSKALMKLYPSFRIDVYPTHRSVWYPQYILDNTRQNAGKAGLDASGLALIGAHAQVAFPIPANGQQAIWNHLTRYGTLSSETRARAYNVDANGSRSLSSDMLCNWENPFWNPDPVQSAGNSRFVRCFYQGPARRVGEATMSLDVVDQHKGRRAWQYLPGQRRVRLAPDLAFDTPNPGTAGVQTFDEVGMYNGSIERYDWKLVGKKEMYVPYNAYRAAFQSTPEQLLGERHLNPDQLRWELHRVWVVEAQLKEGKRHIYKQRRFYLDEDSWAVLATEAYDASNTLFKAGFAMQASLYDSGGFSTEGTVFYDLIGGNYSTNATPFASGKVKVIDPLPKREWTADALTGAGVR
ncbi:DUF1329 domain-containing protein [Pseudomonas sp. NPDC090755]|uniref:DUF1329 domain-containing protein n=1 Tax=Pseudomonas sp. NPDC090755 TaxID=3364481 RepID=UPI00383A47A9